MENKLNLYQKLLVIQKSISGLGKDKDGVNYKYVSGSKLLSHIKPLMNELGLLLKQEIVSLENVRQDYGVVNKYARSGESAVKTKSEILSKCEFRFTWIDTETGEKDVNSFFANGQNDFDKGVGSACTYAERYFIMKYFHIATDEDDVDNIIRETDDAIYSNDEHSKKAVIHHQTPTNTVVGEKPVKAEDKTPEERIENMKKALNAASSPEQRLKVINQINKVIYTSDFTDEHRAHILNYIKTL